MLLTYQSLSFIAGVIDGAANPALDDNNDAGGANVDGAANPALGDNNDAVGANVAALGDNNDAGGANVAAATASSGNNDAGGGGNEDSSNSNVRDHRIIINIESSDSDDNEDDGTNNDGTNNDRTNGFRIIGRTIDPGLYDDNLNLDDYNANIERFGTGSERLAARRNEIDRMGSVLLGTSECFICKMPVTITENALASGRVYHSECVTTYESPICQEEIGDKTPKELDCGHLFPQGCIDECSICQEEIRNRIPKILSCGHLFHQGCINQGLCHSVLCPLCRTNQRG